MADLGQAQVGHKSAAALRSTPKLTRINGDDNLKVIWKNMGNNHAYPVIWGQEFTVESGIDTMTLISGVKFHGMELTGTNAAGASYLNVQVTPNWDCGSHYITKNDTTKEIIFTCTSGSAGADDGSSKIDVKFMLGADNPVIDGIYCSTWSAANIRANYP